jgi:hypothetical protein
MEGIVTISLEDYEILKERIKELEDAINQFSAPATEIKHKSLYDSMCKWKKNYDKKYKFIN